MSYSFYVEKFIGFYGDIIWTNGLTGSVGFGENCIRVCCATKEIADKLPDVFEGLTIEKKIVGPISAQNY